MIGVNISEILGGFWSGTYSLFVLNGIGIQNVECFEMSFNQLQQRVPVSSSHAFAVVLFPASSVASTRPMNSQWTATPSNVSLILPHFAACNRNLKINSDGMGYIVVGLLRRVLMVFWVIFLSVCLRTSGAPPASNGDMSTSVISYCCSGDTTYMHSISRSIVVDNIEKSQNVAIISATWNNENIYHQLNVLYIRACTHRLITFSLLLLCLYSYRNISQSSLHI